MREPAWPDRAHRKLDTAALDAYSWPHGVSNEEIPQRLLALNQARSSTGGARKGMTDDELAEIRRSLAELG